MAQFTYLSFKDTVTVGERKGDTYAEIGSATDGESARKLTARLNQLYEALDELMDQLEGVGIAVADSNDGQWHGAEGLSFEQARRALGKA